MINKTQEQIEELLDEYNVIQEEAVKIAEVLTEMEGKRRFFDTQDIVWDGYGLRAKYDVDMGCGYTEDRTIDIPLSYLTDDDWLTQAKAAINKRKVKEKEERRLKEEKAKRADEDAAYRRFLELKDRFEGESNEED